MLVVYVSEQLFQDFFFTITIIILILSGVRVCGPSEFHAICSVVYKFNYLLYLYGTLFSVVLLHSSIHVSIVSNFVFFNITKFGELSLWGEIF
jgi:hypothetical protein